MTVPLAFLNSRALKNVPWPRLDGRLNLVRGILFAFFAPQSDHGDCWHEPRSDSSHGAA